MAGVFYFNLSLHLFIFLRLITAVDKPLKPDISNAISQCGPVTELQSSVIRIMAAHYEYGKGIHNLHTLANHLRHEVVNLRSEVNDLQESAKHAKPSGDKKHSLLLNDIARYMHTFFYSTNPAILKKYHQFAPDYLSFVGNISEAMDKQIADQNQLLQKVTGLKKEINKALTLINKIPVDTGDTALLNSNEPMEILLKELAKSRQTQDSMEKRLEWLEQAVHTLKQQGDHGSKKKPKKDQSACPRGFYRHALSCYKFVNKTEHWVNAEKHCQGLHPLSHLVSIENQHENDFLVNYRQHNAVTWTSQYLWTGGSDMNQEGVWTWVGSQQPFQWTHWMPGEPSNHNEDQHCVYMRTEGEARWDDWHCYAARLNFVCEIELSEN